MPRKQAAKSKSGTRAKSTPGKSPPAKTKQRSKRPVIRNSPLFNNPAIAPVVPAKGATVGPPPPAKGIVGPPAPAKRAAVAPPLPVSKPAAAPPAPARKPAIAPAAPGRLIPPAAAGAKRTPLSLPAPVQLGAFEAARLSRPAFFDWPVGLASALVGLAAGWQVLGACTMFRAEIDPLPATTTMVAVIALLGVAVGLLAPSRVPMLVRPLRGHSPTDRAASWLRLGLLSAAGALATLLAVALGGPILGTYRRALDQFFWNNITLAGLEWALVAAVVAGPCLTVGVVLSLVSTCGRDSGESRTGFPLVSGCVLLGTALAMAASVVPGWPIHAEQQVVVGTLPLFALAVGALYMSSKPAPAAAPRPDRGPLAVRASFAEEALSRVAPLIWAFTLALGCTGWLSLRPEARAWAGRCVLFLLACVALSQAGASVLWGSLSRRPSSGTSVWLCGLGAGLAAILAGGSAGSWGWPGLELALIALPAGQGLYAMSRLGQGRFSPHSVCLAHLGVMVLTGSALGLAAGQWWALPQLGAMGTLAASALVLLGLGGLLEVHGEVRPLRAEQLRLAVVFASLAIAMVTFPALARSWTRRHPPGLAAHSADARTVEVVRSALVGVRTACLIGVDEAAIGPLPDGRATRVEFLPLASWLPPRDSRFLDDRVHLISMPAPRALRLTRMRYQLVYQALAAERDDPAVFCSAEWLSRLYQRVAAGGTLMLDLPLAGLDRSQVRDVAATFRQATAGHCSWRLIADPRPKLLLRSDLGLDPDRADQTGWYPIEELLTEDQGVPRGYSIRRTRATYSAASRKAGPVLEWLASRINGGAPVARGATPKALPQ